VILAVILAAFTLLYLYTIVAGLWVGIPVTLEDFRMYIVLVAVYGIFIVSVITRPRRIAKNVYLRVLKYYDGTIPPNTSRFFEGHFVSEDVDTRYITPYNKLARVEQKGNLLIFIRQDSLSLHISMDTFTKGTAEEFLRFIREKAPQAFPPEKINTQK
jgi:hypothetical protein